MILAMKMREGAQLPERALDWAAGADLRVVLDAPRSCDQCGELVGPADYRDDARCPLHAAPEPYASCDGTLMPVDGGERAITLLPGGAQEVRFGIALEIPDGYAGLLVVRSSFGRRGLISMPVPGVVDSDYRGELSCALWNAGDQEIRIDHGDRVCQLVVVPVMLTTFGWGDHLAPSQRGARGFGSTGVR